MILDAAIRLRDQFTATFSRAHRETNRLTTRIRLLGNMVARPVIAITDRATKVLGGIKNTLFSIQGLAATALAGFGVGNAIGAGMMLEQQQISMSHFIGIQNKGMSEADVKKQADEYIGWMRKYADYTPFGTDEVITGGARAINVAGGDIAKAKELVSLTGDMAALNPTKTFGDAMEALADAKVGEFERLKEFGFKISADEFKGYVGKGKNDDLTSVETDKAYSTLVNTKLAPFFSGGAEKLSKSSAGLWSTITGGMGTAVTNIGTGILDGLKPQLQAVVDFMGTNGEKITTISTKMGQGIGAAITWIGSNFDTWSAKINTIMPPVKSAMASVFEWLAPKITYTGQVLSSLQTMWSTAWPLISSVIQTAWTIIKPSLDIVWSTLQIVWAGFRAAWPGIVSTVQAAWSILKPIFDGIAKGLGWISDRFKWVAGKVGVSGSKPPGKAMGMSYVPYDNYPSLLHKGEQVLTRAQADQYRNNGKSQGGNIFNININGVNKSTKEIISEMVAEIKEASGNMGVA